MDSSVDVDDIFEDLRKRFVEMARSNAMLRREVSRLNDIVEELEKKYEIEIPDEDDDEE